MDADLKRVARGLILELRHILEGKRSQEGDWQPGDLERRLNAIGVWRDRVAKPIDELPHLTADDKAARRTVEAFLRFRAEAGVQQAEAVDEFVRESAYSWANRLLALRCMEARGIVDEVVLQKPIYGGKSLKHSRFCKKNPDACGGDDDGLFAVLILEFAERAKELPNLFSPDAPAIQLRPSIENLKRCIALLSGIESIRSQIFASDVLFEAPDALGWAYQYWNAEEKDRVFETLRVQKGAKLQGEDVVTATQLYTESYMVKCLVQNSLGATWMGMRPKSTLCRSWERYSIDATRAPSTPRDVSSITFLDPACGSGHFLLEAFDILYAMYEEEGILNQPEDICISILNSNLFGIDIDERATQITEATLWMRARERAPTLKPEALSSFKHHIIPTNIHLPHGRNHLDEFFKRYPEDEELRTAVEEIFDGLSYVHELGTLAQVEAPVETRLRELKEREEFEKAQSHGSPQGELWDRPGPTILPFGVDDWETWKRRTLQRLRDHFGAEASQADQVQSFFGKSAQLAVALFDLLAQRYDIVATNPPYMGSRNMGRLLRAYVERHYPQGKRDLCTAFVVRCLQLAKSDSGRIAMVTQHSWLFLRSYEQLRNNFDQGTESPDAFGGVLRETTIEVLVHLGSGAFEEVSGEVVKCALFVLARVPPPTKHSLVAYRLIGPRSASEKDAALLKALRSSGCFDRYRPEQRRFLSIPQSPICYWLSTKFFDLLSGPTLKSVSNVYQGLATGDDARFVRFVWEMPNQRVNPKSMEGWVPYEKGGGYGKWYGHHLWVVDWRLKGARIRGTAGPRVQNERFYFASGWTYSVTASGCVGFRVLEDAIFSTQSAGVVGSSAPYVAVTENARVSSWIVRSLTAQMYLRESYVQRLPIAAKDDGLDKLGKACIALKKAYTRTELRERTFQPTVFREATMERLLNVSALLHTLEGEAERRINDAYGLSSEEVTAVVAETGIPVGWYPAIEGHDRSQLPPSSWLHEFDADVWGLVEATLHSLERKKFSQADLKGFKTTLRQLFEAGPGSRTDEDGQEGVEEAEDENVEDLGSHAPMPAETFLEELAQKLKIHPISVCALVVDGIEREGWRCRPVEKRRVCDELTVFILGSLGYRWPSQVEGDETRHDQRDGEGVIPLAEGSGGDNLASRLKSHLGDRHGVEEALGLEVDRWLSVEFFSNHVKEYRKRPIVWQLQSHALDVSGRGRRGSSVFSCVVLFQGLDADTIPRIRTQFAGPLRARYETELRTLERIGQPNSEQESRKVTLDRWVTEMKDFETSLQQVAASGFEPGTSGLLGPAVTDALLSLTGRWLDRASKEATETSVSGWSIKAEGVHPLLPILTKESVSCLGRFCSAVAHQEGLAQGFGSEASAEELRSRVISHGQPLLSSAFNLAANELEERFRASALKPIVAHVADLKGEIKVLEQRLREESMGDTDMKEVRRSVARMRHEVMTFEKARSALAEGSLNLCAEIRAWRPQQITSWENWLRSEPLFDAFAALDGVRRPPTSLVEFARQEAGYVPDINDGVRVNIAPLQRAGVLAGLVLPAGDVEKAITDRASWRAEERRWCREGRLPHPGWWKEDSAPGAAWLRAQKVKETDSKIWDLPLVPSPEEDFVLKGTTSRTKRPQSPGTKVGGAVRSQPAAGSEASAQTVLTWLRANPGTHGKRAVLQGSGVEEAAWALAVRILKERGQIIQDGGRRGATYRLA